MIYLTTDCHTLPLTGLNASVYTGLNAQKLKVDGWDWISECTYAMSSQVLEVASGLGNLTIPQCPARVDIGSLRSEK